jgi:hypothetical protein
MNSIHCESGYQLGKKYRECDSEEIRQYLIEIGNGRVGPLTTILNQWFKAWEHSARPYTPHFLCTPSSNKKSHRFFIYDTRRALLIKPLRLTF